MLLVLTLALAGPPAMESSPTGIDPVRQSDWRPRPRRANLWAGIEHLPAALLPFRTLYSGRLGLLSLAGGSLLGGAARCGGLATGGCIEANQAALGLMWQPGSLGLSVFAAVVGETAASRAGMEFGAAGVVGLVVPLRRPWRLLPPRGHRPSPTGGHQ